MTRFIATLFSLFLFLNVSPGAYAFEEGHSQPQSFKAADGRFLLNGDPFIVKAAELHYPRIPRPYWEQRIRMCKALGMNTICLYVFWNSHEPTPDSFDFTGQNDLREFVRLCADNDMKVILRPGPYVCAEWEMGGLPWWLLKKKDIRLRETDPYFMERVDKFQKAVAGQVADLTVDKGGPIIMMQVENEYGSYGTDKPYVSAIRDMLRSNFGEEVVLFQCDWSSNFLNNGLDDLIWTINFGTGADIESQFAPLREARPDSPLMCSEFWSGWFDKWGASHETRPADEMIKGIEEMLKRNISFSLYMTHGGTNWGHWAGANSPGFAPDVTSYDYDAPINETGAPTPKYHQLRRLLSRYNGGLKLPDIPASPKPVSVRKFELTEVAPLFDNLHDSVFDNEIRTMEEYDCGFGSILYRTKLPALPQGALLTVEEPHDYAQIFVDGRFIGKLDRRHGERELRLPSCSKDARLDILVEAMGRINFGRAIKDYKGITGRVTVTEERDGYPFTCDLKNWQVFPVADEMEVYETMNFVPVGEVQRDENGRLPRGVYRGKFVVGSPSDTFLNFETWGKGLVYVNGHPLGRIWEIGPQQTLYMPGCWLKKGENEIMVFDIIGPHEAVSEGMKTPVLDCLKPDLRNADLSEAPQLEGLQPIYSGKFTQGNGWQRHTFGSAGRGRHLILEITEILDGGKEAAIAELYLLDADGNRIPREAWKATYVDSQLLQGNHTADKAFDLQESTWWQSDSATLPHVMVIDLGKEFTIGGMEYLPRMGQNSHGVISRYNLYLK